MRIPTLEEFLKEEYDKLPDNRKPVGFYGHMAFFVQTEKRYRELYFTDDGK